MKRSIAILLILLASLHSKAEPITSLDIETVITEQTQTHAEIVLGIESLVK